MWLKNEYIFIIYDHIWGNEKGMFNIAPLFNINTRYALILLFKV